MYSLFHSISEYLQTHTLYIKHCARHQVSPRMPVGCLFTVSFCTVLYFFPFSLLAYLPTMHKQVFHNTQFMDHLLKKCSVKQRVL